MTYDLIIIGGGPAGFSAAIYAARQKLNTLLIAKEMGGQPINAWQIENYLGIESILGVELTQKFINHVKKFEVAIKEEEVDDINKIEAADSGLLFEVLTKKNRYQAKSIIIASGKSRKKLDIPGEKEFDGKGVVHCATCDAALFKDKTTVVVGAGNAGLDAAIQLTSYAKKIYLLNKYNDLIKGDQSYISQVKNSPTIEVINHALIKEIKGDKFVNTISYEDVESQQIKELLVDGVFIEVGSSPNLQFAEHLLEYNEKGEIKINPKTTATSCPGIFAAGDVTDIAYKQIIIAAGEGAKAALSAYYFVKR